MNTGACGVVSIALLVSSFVWLCVAVHSWSIWSRVSAINSMLCSPHPTLCFKTVPLLCLLYAPRYCPAVGLYDTCSWYELFHTYGSTILHSMYSSTMLYTASIICMLHDECHSTVCYVWVCPCAGEPMCGGTYVWGNLCVQYALLSDMYVTTRWGNKFETFQVKGLKAAQCM